MSEITTQLGYYPKHLDIDTGRVSVVTLSDLPQTVDGIGQSDTVCDGWVYAPPQGHQDLLSGRATERPYSARVFGLPKTHRMTHRAADSDEQLEFLVWCMGFFAGMRLTKTEAGFLDATPIKPGKLVDFVLSNCTLAHAIELADVFWSQHGTNDRNATRIEAAIHALFLSQYPRNLEFERFMHLYAALDACFAVAKSIRRPPSRLSHARRLHWMCEEFGVPTPPWAHSDTNSRTPVSIVRNDAFHEALFFGAPFGFAVHGPFATENLTLEMSALASRLLVALLGNADSDYVRSPTNTQQRHGLLVEPSAR